MRYIATIPPGSATGLTAAVYGEVERDYGLLCNRDGNSPFMCHSPLPEVLAAFWSALYETVTAEGKLKRATKEQLASVIAAGNDCPFGAQAHALIARATGAGPPNPVLLAWAERTDRGQTEIVDHPPFSQAECAGGDRNSCALSLHEPRHARLPSRRQHAAEVVTRGRIAA